MSQFTVTRTIKAPIEIVFKAITDVEGMPDTNPDIVSTEFLSETRSGVGTRFREQRRMGKQVHVTELDVTEFVENEHVRMVADSHGTIWDTSFDLTPAPGNRDHTEITITMDANARSLLPRIMNFLFRGMIQRGSEKHFDVMTAWCEKQAGEGL